jgi:hypothetical protein
MFKWALDEAHRLGIKVGVHNCDGWSTTAGTWITPEKSMKETTWSIASAKGGKTIKMQLLQPSTKRDFYRDVAVIAYKLPDNAVIGVIPPINTFLDKEVIDDINSLNDGNPISGIEVKENQTVDLVFDKPVKYNEIMMHFQKIFLWRNMGDIKISGELSVSDNSIDFTTIEKIVDYPVNKCMNINVPEGSLKTLRFKLDTVLKNESFGPITLTEFNLLYKGKSLYQSDIPAHLPKIVMAKANRMSDYEKKTDSKAKTMVKVKDVINISKYMDNNGLLTWKAPKGNWKIIRFGYTTTGATNYPATKAGRGLECNKMDAEALKIHFEHFPMELINAAGSYTGNTFQYIFGDSGECTYPNWTEKFKEEFAKRQGYDITHFIPAICGDIVESPEITERFFYDYQKTIAGLIEDEYRSEEHTSELQSP